MIRDSALYTAGKLLPGLLGMATTALLTRLLDPAAYGRYGLALVVATFGSALAFDWLGIAYLRVAQAAPGAFGTVLVLFAGLLGLACTAAAALWLAGAFDGPAGWAVASGLLLMACYAAFELAARRPVANFQPGRFLLMNAARGVLGMAGAVGAAALTGDAAVTACGTALGTAGGVLVGGAPRSRPRLDPALARKLLLFGGPLAGSMALASLATSGVRFLLDALGSAEALGLYTAAFLLVQNTLSVAAAGIASAGYSAAVRAMDRGEPEAAKGQVAATWSLLLAVLSPMAVGMVLTAPALAAVTVAPAYRDGFTALAPWLAVAGLLGAFRAQGLDQVFQIAHRPMRLAAVSATAALVALTLAAALIPRFGPSGAAAASASSTAVSCMLAAWLGQRTWPVPWPMATTVRTAVACTVMAASVSAVPGGLAIQVATGLASYGAAAVALDLLGVRRRWTARRVPQPAT